MHRLKRRTLHLSIVLALTSIAIVALSSAADDAAGRSAEAASPGAKAAQIVIENNQGIAFKNAAGAEDGTEIRRFSGNALRFRYAGNAAIFDSLDGQTFQIRDAAGAIRLIHDPTPVPGSGLLQLRHDTYADLSIRADIQGTPNFAQLALATANGFYASNATPGDTVVRAIGEDLILYASGGAVRLAAGTGGGIEKMTVQSNGNVGIGVTNPTDKLEVDGTIRAREVIVTQNGWPDHVFDDGYPLLPIDQLERMIAERGHLPGVPSAAQVASDGVTLGDMQATLLEKVEELTLYVIALNKDNDQLRADLEGLTERMGDGS